MDKKGEIHSLSKILNPDIAVITNISSAHLKNFKNKNGSEEFDKAAEDLRLATRHLGMIVGKVDVEEILGSIFNDFCIGK